MKKFGLLLFACALFSHKAHAQIVPGEACKTGACYGFGVPTGFAPNGYIYQDVSQTPNALYCPKLGTWAPCGGSGGSTFPGTVHQQVFSAGSGSGAASAATLDAAGNAVDNSFGGTVDANIISATTPTSFDAINKNLQTIGNYVTVNQGYPATEYPSFSGFRAQLQVFGNFNFGKPTPPFAYDTSFTDHRALNQGDLIYNPYGIGHPPSYYRQLIKDDDEAGSNSQVQNYFPLQDSASIYCCGVPLFGTVQNTFVLHSHYFIDNSQGISAMEDHEAAKNGAGDFQLHDSFAHCNGATRNFSDEGCWIYRDQIQEDSNPFWGTTTALAKGTTILPITPGAGSNAPAEGRLLMDVTQQHAAFHITAVGAPAYPLPGVYTTDTTFTPSTFSQVQFTVSVPPLTKGQTTPSTVFFQGLTAPLVTTLPLCIASQNGIQQVSVTSVGTFTSGFQSAVLNLRKTVTANEFAFQGAYPTCTVLEPLANEAPGGGGALPYRDMIYILGNNPFLGSNTLYYVSQAAGNWTTTPNGFFSSANIPSGTTLTRNGSGVVTLLGPADSSHSLVGTKWHVIGTTDITYEGTFTVTSETGTSPTTLTWANAGSAGSTTTTATSWGVAPNGSDVSAAALAPGAEVVRANNPTTRVADGTVVIETNAIQPANGDQFASSVSDQNILGVHHEFVQIVSSPSPSIAPAVGREMEVINPCDFCVHDRVALAGSGYVGGGGFRQGSYIWRSSFAGAPIWGGYDLFSAPVSGGYLRHVIQCGLKPCTDAGAFYSPDIYDGGNNGSFHTEWHADTGSLIQILTGGGASTSTITQNEGLYSFNINDGAGTTNFVSLAPTATIFGKKVTVTDNSVTNPITAVSGQVTQTCLGASSTSSAVEWDDCVTGFTPGGSLVAGQYLVRDRTNNINAFGATDTANVDYLLRQMVSGSTVNGQLICLASGTNCPTSGSVVWNTIANPTGNLSLAMAANTTLLTYGATTGSVDLFKKTDTTGNTGTGILDHDTTASGSALTPWQADANGVGFKVTSAGKFQSTDTVNNAQDTYTTGSGGDSTCVLNTTSASFTNCIKGGVPQVSVGPSGPYTPYTLTIASGTATLGTSAIASGACATVVAVAGTGIASTDAITWNPNGSIKAITGYVPSTSGGLTIAPYPTSGNVNFDVCNWTSASITPGAVTLNWRVTR